MEKVACNKPLMIIVDRIGVDLSNVRTSLKMRGLKQASCVSTIPLKSQDVSRLTDDEISEISDSSFTLDVGRDKAAVKLSELLDADFAIIPANCIADIEAHLHLVRPLVVVNVTEDKSNIMDRLEKRGVSSTQAEAMVDMDLQAVKSIYIDRTISLSRYVLSAAVDEIEEFYRDICNQYIHADFGILELDRKVRRRRLAKYGSNAEDLFRVKATVVLFAMLVVLLIFVSVIGEAKATAMREFVTDTQQKVTDEIASGFDSAVNKLDIKRS